MLQVARVAPRVLGDSAALVRDFLLRQLSPGGAFGDRDGREDLYYTVFGLDALLALRAEFPLGRVEAFLRRQGGGAGLDFVHLCCLARCWGCLGDAGVAGPAGEDRQALAERILSHRAPDGGFSPVPSGGRGTAYAAFLALGALQDLRVALPDPGGLAASLGRLRAPDGAWGNETGLPMGATNATAAVVTVLRQLGEPVPAGVAAWLLGRAHAQGGFLAAPGAPMPDLLSTATALHALAGLQADLAPVRERCLDFIDTLWTNEGGFHGHWGDDALDVEYTYYGLLALGHLGL